MSIFIHAVDRDMSPFVSGDAENPEIFGTWNKAANALHDLQEKLLGEMRGLSPEQAVAVAKRLGIRVYTLYGGVVPHVAPIKEVGVFSRRGYTFHVRIETDKNGLVAGVELTTEVTDSSDEEVAATIAAAASDLDWEE